jgi:hypothetical protein
LSQLVAADIVATDKLSARFLPASPELARLCEELARTNRERPIALRDAIVFPAKEKLRIFSDAFRVREKNK